MFVLADGRFGRCRVQGYALCNLKNKYRNKNKNCHCRERRHPCLLNAGSVQKPRREFNLNSMRTLIRREARRSRQGCLRSQRKQSLFIAGFIFSKKIRCNCGTILNLFKIKKPALWHGFYFFSDFIDCVPTFEG
jgi:hypothetical protein